MALSYVWGTPNMANEETWQRALPGRTSLLDSPDTPQTFLDAITFVKSLGEKYLWVDAVCISQVDAEEKAFLIPRMAAIYSNAILTIIAADGKDSRAGIRRLVGTAVRQDSSFCFKQNDIHITITRARSSLSDVLQKTPWRQRGWTFQEADSAQASVICTRDEVFFKSEHFIAREAHGPIRITYSSLKPAQSGKATETAPIRHSISHRFSIEYNDKLYDYSRRQFTHAGDRLDAFFAVANAEEPDISVEARHALSGLRLKMFATDLGWVFCDDHDAYDRVRIEKDHRRTRLLPSWSWVE